MDGCPANQTYGIRNRALIIVLWRSGLRISEALDLCPKDVDFGPPIVLTVLSGKGGKRRTVGLDAHAGAELSRWLWARSALGVPPTAPIFCTVQKPHPGGPIHPAYYRELFRDLGRRVGITKRCHPHGLRHTCAFELANENTPVHLIQAQLGHTSLATTSRYTSHLAPRQLLHAIHDRQWPGDECR